MQVALRRYIPHFGRPTFYRVDAVYWLLLTIGSALLVVAERVALECWLFNFLM